MRFLAILPILLCAAALVLSFLCLFAGSSKGFMEEYALVTLNTSQFGSTLFNTSESSTNPFLSLLDNATNSIESSLNADLASVAQDLGLHDFYSAHILNYCEGYYTPGPVPNATLSKHDIHRNITACSNKTAGYTFDPRATLAHELNTSTNGLAGKLNLTDLNWPAEIDKGLHALRIASIAMFALYCVGIAFIALALLLALASIFFQGRLSSFVNVLVDCLAFLAIGLASAIATAIAVKAADVINSYGKDVGISAQKGSRFLVLTWVATALMLGASLTWCAECVAGRGAKRTRRSEKRGYGEDGGY
ncbi:hypothetical protein LTR08_002017 [Meristemomyces frigidus]|nr:hypothetical protein LTR08_002017 [Meristemomyces frigidus]